MEWKRLNVRRKRARRSFRGWPVALGVLGTIVANSAYAFRSDPKAWTTCISVGSVLLAGACLIGLLRLLRSWRQDGRAAAGWRELRCERCEFDLRGSADGRCPECGAENRKLAKLIGETGPVLLEKARGNGD